MGGARQGLPNSEAANARNPSGFARTDRGSQRPPYAIPPPYLPSPASALLQRQLQSKRNEHGTGHTVQTAHHGGAGQPSCQWAGGGDEKGEPEHAQERVDGRQ
ncbi:hypothetical protein G6F65_021290 [Rhizopus arrhizus]|nr:hypothetical protein G6F65_021290 [Rhizopus arrhizus]